MAQMYLISLVPIVSTKHSLSQFFCHMSAQGRDKSLEVESVFCHNSTYIKSYLKEVYTLNVYNSSTELAVYTNC